MIFTSQARIHSPNAVSQIASVSVKQTTTIAYAGFSVGARLPVSRDQDPKAGTINGFIYVMATTIRISFQTSYRFSPCQGLPQKADPFGEWIEHAQRHPATTMLFEQSQVTTVSVMYFGYVCRHDLASRSLKPLPMQAPKQLASDNAPAAPRASSFKPAPQAANVPARAPAPASAAPDRPSAAISLKSIDPSKKPDPSNWEDLPGVVPKGARYELWDMERKNSRRPVQVSLTDSPTVRKVTPQQLAPNGLSFTAVNENDTVESIPLDKVKSFRVLSA